MATSVEQVHHGKLNYEPRTGASVRLFIDLDVCAQAECKQCTVDCSYFYHPGNNGVFSVAELATFALVCRRCEEPHCVAACPVEALEQQSEKENLLIRHNVRCVGCRTCSHACPYGTIYPEYVPVMTHVCDFCSDRRDVNGEPVCAVTCPYNAISLRSTEGELPQDTFLVGDNLLVHSTHWDREKA